MVLIGACFSNCYIINEENTAILASTVSWPFTDNHVMGTFCEKINFVKVFETAIGSRIVIIFGSEANGEWSLIESVDTKQLVIFSE